MPTSRSSGRRPSASGGSYRPCATSVRPQWPPTRNRTPPNGCSLTAASGSATAATTWPAPSSVRRNTASQASNGPSSRQSPATADHTGTATGRRSSRRATASCTREAVHYRGGPRSLRVGRGRPSSIHRSCSRSPNTSDPTAQLQTRRADRMTTALGRAVNPRHHVHRLVVADGQELRRRRLAGIPCDAAEAAGGLLRLASGQLAGGRPGHVSSTLGIGGGHRNHRT
jgi:hypothetical protein